jgi:endonuclease/exonuclease/phosphatase family metal-dependent hydrolase
MTLRVASYNVRYFGHALKGLASTASSKARIAAAIANLTPLADVVCLQEVETNSLRSTAAHRGRSKSHTQLDAFLVHLQQALLQRSQRATYRAFYYPAHAYQLGPIRVYTTGLAILVNEQTLRVLQGNSSKPFDVTARPHSLLKRMKQTRIAAHLHLENARGRDFHLFNTHLSLPTPWASEFWKQRQKMGFGRNQLAEAVAVSDYVKQVSHRAPFVLVGDFNSAPATPVYRLLTEERKMVSAQSVLKQIDPHRADSFSTAGFLNLRMHLDHIFGHQVDFTDMQDTFRFGDTQSPFHGLSDHVPLIARFEI